MSKTLITLHDALKRINITTYRLAAESKIRGNTVYSIEKNEAVFIKIETIHNLIVALNKIAENDGYDIEFNYDDLLKVVDDDYYESYKKQVYDFYDKEKRNKKK